MIRYPGGKRKLKDTIITTINRFYREFGSDYCYTEPFVGGMSICGLLIQNNNDIKKIAINDYDIGIASLWNSVIFYPDELCKKVQEFKPSVDCFFSFSEELKKLNRDEQWDVIDVGFKKMAVHQMSYSGL